MSENDNETVAAKCRFSFRWSMALETRSWSIEVVSLIPFRPTDDPLSITALGHCQPVLGRDHRPGHPRISTSRAVSHFLAACCSDNASCRLSESLLNLGILESTRREFVGCNAILRFTFKVSREFWIFEGLRLVHLSSWLTGSFGCTNSDSGGAIRQLRLSESPGIRAGRAECLGARSITSASSTALLSRSTSSTRPGPDRGGHIAAALPGSRDANTPGPAGSSPGRFHCLLLARCRRACPAPAIMVLPSCR